MIRVAALAASLLSVAATTARAQTTVERIIGPPRVTWTFSPGDRSGGRGDTLGPRSILVEPIRLSLLGMAVPGATGDSGCRGAGPESAGTATAGVRASSMQHATTLWLTPKLTLVGFSRTGCQLDAAVGGALVYATPIRDDIWFVASAGILHLPHAGGVGGAQTTGQLRVDLVFAQPEGRSYAVGIGTRGLSFGGTL